MLPDRVRERSSMNSNCLTDVCKSRKRDSPALPYVFKRDISAFSFESIVVELFQYPAVQLFRGTYIIQK